MTSSGSNRQPLLSIVYACACLFAAFVVVSPRLGWADQASLLDPASKNQCQQLLADVKQVSSQESVLEMLDDLEQVLLILESTYPDLDLSSIRLEVEELIDLTLAEGPLDEIRRRFENVVHSVFNLRTVEEEKVSERIHSFSLLILDPNQLKASIAYEVSNQSISSVRFEEGVVRDLSKVSSDMIKRMFRSIEKGFVPPLSGSGIVRMTDVHKKFIEVKTIGFGGSIRLLGCLEGNTITIKKLYYKKNDGAGGSLQAYAGLCK